MIDTSVKQTIEASVLCWLATCDATGQPNVSPKEVFAARDAEHLVIAHIASPRSVRNLADNPHVCVSMVDVFRQKGHKLLGTARLIWPGDAAFESAVAPLILQTQGRFPIHAVIVVRIEHVEPIVAPSYRLFPKTTEAMQMANAWQTYGVRPIEPVATQTTLPADPGTIAVCPAGPSHAPRTPDTPHHHKQAISQLGAHMNQWKLAQRAAKMNPSVIREILKVTEKPGIISFAGGLPSPDTFPIQAMAEATQKVLSQDGRSALQYAASEGYGPLRDWVAHDLKKQGMAVDPDQVLITTGSQQGLDLVAKILIDAGSRILVETPTYLGALQAYTPMEPTVVSVDSDDEGVQAEDLRAKAGTGADAARFVYLLPNFQNPTGRTMTEARRAAVAQVAIDTGLPVIEDNPYGDLWFDAPPPASLASRNPEGTVYLGSFSKILAPGLRLGYIVAPKALYPKLLQAKQAADLHTPSFNQRIVAEVLKDGFIDRHVPTIRALYKSQCEAMLAALEREFGHSGHGGGDASLQWNRPAGGMFLWTRLPAGLDAVKLLPQAVDHNVAFVPGSAFYADHADPRSMRLSFVTATVDQINTGIAALAATIRDAQSRT